MIGGHDVTFRTETPAQVTDGAVRIVRASWQEAVVENAETGELLQRDSLVGVGELPTEIFVYKSTAARASWTAKGAAPENANLMVHIIRGENSMTIVVDDPSATEMEVLIAAISDHVYQDIFWMRATAA
jgi:hypothetical protein